MNGTKKLPWPSDAIMVVASEPGEANLDNMPEGVMDAECRDCGRALWASVFTYRKAIEHPLRHHRPVKYFCIPCATEKYSFRSIEHFTDHRNLAAVFG